MGAYSRKCGAWEDGLCAEEVPRDAVPDGYLAHTQVSAPWCPPVQGDTPYPNRSPRLGHPHRHPILHTRCSQSQYFSSFSLFGVYNFSTARKLNNKMNNIHRDVSCLNAKPIFCLWCSLSKRGRGCETGGRGKHSTSSFYLCLMFSAMSVTPRFMLHLKQSRPFFHGQWESRRPRLLFLKETKTCTAEGRGLKDSTCKKKGREREGNPNL